MLFWLGVIVSLCYIPGVTGAFIATQWPVLALLLSLGLWRPGPVTAFHGLWLVFLVYATAHMAFTPTPYASVFGLWLVWIMGLALWFGTTIGSPRRLYAGLAVGGAVSSFLAVLQHFGWHGLPMTSADPAGLYVNSVQQGAILAMLVVALTTERMWLWILPLLPGLVLSHSRGAALALAVGLLGAYVRRVWVLGLLGGAGVAFLLSPLSSSDAQRIEIWQTAWANLSWLGLGPGVFYTIAIPQPLSGGWLYPEHAHNDALQLAFEYGIGALPVFAVFAFALTRTQSREWPAVLAFITLGCYSMALWMPVTSFLGLVCVGRILRRHALHGQRGVARGSDVLSWIRQRGRPRVPVPSYHPAEG